MLPAGERVDDEHGSATFGTDERTVVRHPDVMGFFRLKALRHRLRGYLRILTAQQLARLCQILFSPGVGDQTVVADAVEPWGEDMEQETAHKLLGGERHGLVPCPALGPVILPAESHAAFIQCNETAVGNGHPMGIARQIGEHRRRSREGALGVDDPLALTLRVDLIVEGRGIGQRLMLPEELQLASTMGGGELLQKQAPEQPGEDTHR